MSRARDIANLQSSKITADAGIDIDNINIDGAEIDVSTNFTLDSSGYIIIDADTDGNIYLNDNTEGYGQISGVSRNLTIKAPVADKDIIFQGNDSDGGGAFTALTLDMSDAGSATFNSTVGIGMTPDSAVKLSVSGAVGPTNGSNSAPTHTFYGDPDTGMYRSGANALSFTTGGTAALAINSSQNVGIGNAVTDSWRLEVLGARVSSGGGYAVAAFRDSTAYNTSDNGGGITLQGLYNSSGSYTNFAAIQGIKENNTDGNYASALTFKTRANGANLEERIRIDGSGNVLIGTTVTGRALEGADRLTIADASHSGLTIRSGTGGNSNLYGSINFSDQEGGAGEYAGQIWYGHGTLGEKLVLATQGSNRVIVNQNVGIGGDPVSTYSGYDTASLHIRQASSGGGSQIHLTNAESGHAAGNGSFIGQWEDDDLYITNQESDGEIKISTGGLADIILVSSTGKITTTMTNIDYGLVVKNSHGSSPYCQFNQFSGAAPDNNTNTFLHCSDSSTSRLIIYSDGDIDNHDNSYGATSDERIKQDIVDANSQWDDIKGVKVRNFKKKDDVDQYADKAWTQIGVIAQELETVSPKLIKERQPTADDIKHSADFGTLYTKDDAETQDAVLYTSDDDEVKSGEKEVGDIKTPSTAQIGDVKEIKENVKRVKYSVLYMKAIKALQEAMARIETLEAKVTALEGS